MAIIRVGGNLGAGKSTLCKRLAEHLGYEYHYTGGIFRKMAEEKNLSIEEFYPILDSNPELERSVDDRQIAIMMSRDNLVMEGRITAFLPHGDHFRKINLFIKVDEDTGIRRQLNRPENRGKTFEEMKALSRKRVRDEIRRYKNLYGIHNHLDESYYDIIIDATDLSPDRLLEETVRRIEEHIKKPA